MRGGVVANQRGATLMVVLVMVVVLGLAAGATGSTWRTLMQRVKEQELLWRGDQYRRAIRSYYDSKLGGVNRYPENLDDLLRDPRSVETVRHLRELYPDPMTGEEWVTVRHPDGGIFGVHSASRGMPMKLDGFSPENKSFAAAFSYDQWEFYYLPKKIAQPNTQEN